MSAPDRFVEWINANIGFNPRAGKYSDALAQFVVDELRGESKLLDARLTSGAVSAEVNADVETLSATRNVDMVLWGARGSGPGRPVHLGLENKLILAAHGKARKNRLGDIVAFSNHIHNSSKAAIAAGLIGINLSAEYANPDPFAEGTARPTFRMEKVVADTVQIFAQMPQRETADEPYDRPEAFSVFVIRYDGKSSATLITEPPAPQPGSPLHYRRLIERLAREYERRHQ